MSTERVAAIQERINTAFSPVHLEINDDSHLHVGHPGAAGGGGHFRVTIVSDKFENEKTIARHRMIYSALDDMMPAEIHALSISALTPAEYQS